MFVFQELSLLAVLAATTIAFFLGFLWYYKLFAKPWTAAMGLTPDDIDGSNVSVGRAVLGSFVASLVTVLGTALLLQVSAPAGLAEALVFGLVAWFAFSMTPVFKLIFWEVRSVVLVLIDGGYELSSIMLAVFVLTLWPF